MPTIIDVQGLTKRYGNKEVVHSIDFEVQQGEILCILGPNGAGKSTTINIISGALSLDGGSVKYLGQNIFDDLMAYKSRLGIVPQDLALYEDLTAERNVLFFASLYGLKKAALTEACRFALEFTGLEDRAGDKVKTFSGGMKRRLNIACAIAHRPKLLIMDEPTVGIDPQSRNHILEGVKQLSRQGMTIIYTTHYMEEVEEVSTRIIIMDLGSIIAEGTKQSLKADIESERHYQISVEAPEAPDVSDLTLIKGVKAVQFADNLLDITTDRQIENLDQIISTLTAKAFRINDISAQTASLETVFLKMTGRSLRD
ncbi:MAG: ABC transporter ATP-binding protein [Coriobacteriales bacterium]|jgi:ABC-2 type transport system ATP-binding protein|nr:ABC transporter ATP-binding protein [Coriobacteriales bacterium]